MRSAKKSADPPDRVALSLLHPGLMRGLVLIDPVIQTENPSKTFAPASTYRRDTWPSRQDAVDRFSSSKFYQAWDPRVLAQWNKYGVRELPTELYPDAVIQDDPPVTLKTPVSQEVFSYLRPKYYGSHDLPPENDRLTYGDMHPQDIEREYDFYRPEPAELFRRLPDLKPPVVYIFGKHSELATPKLRQKKLDTTGTGVGGVVDAKKALSKKQFLIVAISFLWKGSPKVQKLPLHLLQWNSIDGRRQRKNGSHVGGQNRDKKELALMRNGEQESDQGHQGQNR